MRTGPLYAVKRYCLWCCGDQPKEVKLCPAEDCPIHPLRQGKRQESFKEPVLKAIKMRCYDCSGFEWKEVKECQFIDCSLYPYRLGKNPFLTGKRSSNLAQNGSSEKEDSIKPLPQKETSEIVQ